MLRLTAETQVHHPAADAAVHELLVGAPSRIAYEAFVRTSYGFIEPLEAELDRTPGLRDVIDLRPRRKAELLLRDLVALRIKPEPPAAFTRCTSIPTFPDAATALGWMYVIERSTLVYGTVFRHLASHLPGEMAFGSSYLKCYDARVGETWRAFVEIVETVGGRTPIASNRIVSAAIEAFRCQEVWCRQTKSR